MTEVTTYLSNFQRTVDDLSLLFQLTGSAGSLYLDRQKQDYAEAIQSATNSQMTIEEFVKKGLDYHLTLPPQSYQKIQEYASNILEGTRLACSTIYLIGLHHLITGFNEYLTCLIHELKLDQYLLNPYEFIRSCYPYNLSYQATQHLGQFKETEITDYFQKVQEYYSSPFRVPYISIDDFIQFRDRLYMIVLAIDIVYQQFKGIKS